MPRTLLLATATLVAAACLSQTVPPSAGAGAVVTAAAPLRLQPSAYVPSDLNDQIDNLIGGSAEWPVALSSAERTQLQSLYRRHDHMPIWTDLMARPTPQAREALALLTAAADDGLEPADYDAAALAVLAAAEGMTSIERARFDVGVSAGLLRYLRDLHVGRIDPRTVGFRLRAPVDEHDYAALVDAAIGSGHIAETADALRPQLWAYHALRRARREYRLLAANPTLVPLPPSSKAIHAGDPYAGTAALYHLLLALGDLPTPQPAAADASRYEGPLVDGVKRFQIRHGLDADGVLGVATLRALRTPLAWRVRQIELSLERLRWLPHEGGERLVLVNIPMFRLWAWDSMSPRGTPALATDVIVGRALTTHTPVFVEELREVIFRPYWTVPASILRNEILPKIRRDPEYLQKNDMEVIAPDGRVVETRTPLGLLGGAGYGVRQQPGYRNALGLIKFVFPNQENVYMHDTPAQELFSRSRRDFSHGCVRVRDPVGLAEWALAGVAGWDRDRILSAMTGRPTIHVKVARNTQVVLFYTTAIIAPEDGTLRFAEDLYGHDTRLDRALSKSTTPPGLSDGTL
jgi:murein L,D-transpeptidase YcbB/YkuD